MNELSPCQPPESDYELKLRLCASGVSPTPRRLMVARCVMFRRDHPMAEDVYAALTAAGHDISLATVYNTLGRFVAAGLLRTVQRPGEGLRYDPNTAPHHHFFDVETGRIHDIDIETVRVSVDGERLGAATVDRVAVFIEGRGTPAETTTPS